MVCQQLGYEDGLLATFLGKDNINEKGINTARLRTSAKLPADIRYLNVFCIHAAIMQLLKLAQFVQNKKHLFYSDVRLELKGG